MAFRINGVDVKVSDSDKLDGLDSSAFVQTGSAQALHASDALRISGTTLSLFKGDGGSESVTLPSSAPTTEQVLSAVSPTTGDTYILSRFGLIGEHRQESISYFPFYARVTVSGSIRVTADHRGSINATSTLQVLKNEAVVATWSIRSTSYTSRSVDFSVSVGDLITIQHKSNDGNYSSYMRNTYVKSATNSCGVA
jgi:hypothetical protein